MVPRSFRSGIQLTSAIRNCLRDVRSIQSSQVCRSFTRYSSSATSTNSELPTATGTALHGCRTQPDPNAPRLVTTDREGPVFMIAINRPEKRNCVNAETARQLHAAVEEFENDTSAKVGVLYGNGGTFCAGWDLAALSDLDQKWVDSLPLYPGPMGPSRYFIKKPLIAAVNGYAVAGGLELALMCDLRVVEEDAVMGVFCRRFGVPLVDGGTVRLPALIGYSRAMDLILTGRPVKGQEAFEMGLANRVVPRGTVVGQAVNLAISIAKFPQECMLADRKSAFYSTFCSKNWNDAIEYEHENGKKALVDEAITGAKGFVSGLGKHGKFNFGVAQIEEKVLTKE